MQIHTFLLVHHLQKSFTGEKFEFIRVESFETTEENIRLPSSQSLTEHLTLLRDGVLGNGTFR